MSFGYLTLEPSSFSALVKGFWTYISFYIYASGNCDCSILKNSYCISAYLLTGKLPHFGQLTDERVYICRSPQNTLTPLSDLASHRYHSYLVTTAIYLRCLGLDKAYLLRANPLEEMWNCVNSSFIQQRDYNNLSSYSRPGNIS